jgi:VanZ family protein
MADFLAKLTRLSDLLAAAWAATIAWLSLTPLQQLPLSTPFSDKIEHIAAYGLLGFLALLARKDRKAILLWLPLILLFGALIELLQPYVNRHAELMDLVADGFGALVGALLARRLTSQYAAL